MILFVPGPWILADAFVAGIVSLVELREIVETLEELPGPRGQMLGNVYLARLTLGLSEAIRVAHLGTALVFTSTRENR